MCWNHPKTDSCNTAASFQDNPEGKRSRRTYPIRKLLNFVPGCSFCIEKRFGQRYKSVSMCLIVELNGQRIGRNKIGKLVIRKLGEGYVIYISKWAMNTKISVPHVSTH